MRLLMNAGVRIDDERGAAFRRPLEVLPEGKELLLPVCSPSDRVSVQLVRTGEHVRRFGPLARGKDDMPLAYAPVAGVIGEWLHQKIPGRGEMVCARLLPCTAEGKPHPLARPSRTEVTAQMILRAAGLLHLRDETDGIWIEDKLAACRRDGVDALVCDALCDDPYVSDGLCALTELTGEVCDGLALAAQAAGCGETLIATFRARAAGFRTVQRLKSALNGTELLDVYGRYPIWPAIGRMRRFAGRKLVRIGAQACVQLSRAVRLGRPAERCIVAVSGDGVRTPHHFSVVIGTPISEVLSRCELSEEEIRTVAIRHSVTGEPVENLGAPVLADTRAVLAFTRRMDRRKGVCIGCGRCNEVCGENVFVSEACRAVRHGKPEEALTYGARRCIGCRACDVVCPGGDSLSELVRSAVPPGDRTAR